MIIQKDLATEDKIQVLPGQHLSVPTLAIQDTDLRQDIQQVWDNTD